MPEEKGRTEPVTVPHGRCRCGHYPTQHTVVRPVGISSSFRLDPGGPCAVCGEANCRAYVPAGSAPEPR